MEKTYKQHIVDDVYSGTIKRIVALKDNKKSIFRVAKRERLERLLAELFDKAYTKIGELQCVAYVTPEPLPFSRRNVGRKLTLDVGAQWAESVFDCAWLHFYADLPKDAAAENIVFLINCGGEGLIYDALGSPTQSITCYASDFDYSLGLPVKKVVLPKQLIVGDKIDFYADCGANDLFGKFKNNACLGEKSIAVVNPEIRALAYDCQVLLSVYDNNADNEFTLKIFNTVYSVLKKLRSITNASAAQSRQILLPLLQTKNDTPHTFQYSAIGHAHLDLAWLWPIRESKRKAARTFSTQIMNLERYEDYIFGASQAQMYLWIKTLYPQIYNKVLALHRSGRWEVQGATWIEMDSNLISAESLIRQFYYGKKFFNEEFNEEMRILWLPDSFGYSACLPQVMKLANVPYFLTQKLSWNTVNKFPYHSFKWVGLDGSEVLAHMLPENTYNAPMRADYLKSGEKNYSERKISNIALSLFGIGDGGAGAGFEHLERANRFKDIKGMPKVKMEKAIDFFLKLDNAEVEYPTYNGELYLEKHQGTYTTQAKNKRYNRKCEILLKNYEFLALIAQDGKAPLAISYQELAELWKDILLFQFHDILPGSSIDRVYEESGRRYAEIYDTLNTAIQKIITASAVGQGVVNLNPFSYKKIVKLENEWYRLSIPAMGIVPIKNEYCLGHYEAIITAQTIENDCLKVKFKDGVIISLWDKALNREFVAKGKKLNVFSKYKDIGDCWDIKPVNYSVSKKDAVCTSFAILRDGSEAYAKVQFTIDNIVIDQRISIIDGSTAITFDTKVQNDSASAMLRVAFPVAISTDVCKFNVQFGHIARKTTSENSIEKAQYEVSGQKFVDMSDGSAGISLINDSKYGFRCKNNVIDMNLIRSPKGGPGTSVDQGGNRIVYALFTHGGALGIDTYKEAYLLNNPLIVVNSDRKPLIYSEPYTTTNENIVLESLKKADTASGFIARFYNASEAPQTAEVTIKSYVPLAVVDIMENKICEARPTISLKPFELTNIYFERITP